MANEWDDLSKELTEKRREFRRQLLELGDSNLRNLYYETIVLAEHEAARRAVDKVLSRCHLSNQAEG